MPDATDFFFEHPDSPWPLSSAEIRGIRSFFRFMNDQHIEGKILLFATPEEAATLILFARQSVIDMRELERSEARDNAKQQEGRTNAK